MRTWAKVQTRFEGIHCWPEAPRAVEFLRNPHRHEFHVTLWVQQFHDDRDVEYILLKQWLDEVLASLTAELIDNQHFSCEMMAAYVLKQHGERYPRDNPRLARCEVLEDGENGALLEMV